MLSSRLILGAAAAAFCAAAFAQTQSGFFPPKADPNLTAPDRQVQPAQPAAAAQPMQPAQPAQPAQSPQAATMGQPALGAAPVAPDRPQESNTAIANDPTRLMRWTEQQMDRSEQEAAQAKAQAAARPEPINGAFTGQTSERDR